MIEIEDSRGGGGNMGTLVKGENKTLRRHLARDNGRPLCGGGNGGKTSAYQLDMGDDCNCQQCARIKSKAAATELKT